MHKSWSSRSFIFQQKGQPMGRLDGVSQLVPQKETWYLGSGLNRDGIRGRKHACYFSLAEKGRAIIKPSSECCFGNN
jgi:hypothetical protein